MLQKMVEKLGGISQVTCQKNYGLVTFLLQTMMKKLFIYHLMDIGGITFRLIFSRVKIMVRHGNQLVLIYQIHLLML